MPKISVIIPIYNSEKELSRCLDSVINQSLRDIEVICVNDGSTDGSLAILQEYGAKDNRIKIISKPNFGYGNTLNIGMDNALGEYISIMLSDDFAELNMFEALYDAAHQNDIDIVCANHIKHYLKKDEDKTHLGFQEALSDIVLKIDDYNYLLTHFKPFIRGAIYKRSLLIENDIRFSELYSEPYQDSSFDFFVWACAKSAYFISAPLLHCASGSETFVLDAHNKVFSIFNEYRRIDNFINSHKDKKRFWLTRNYARFKDYQSHYKKSPNKYKSEFLKRFSSEFKKLRDKNNLPQELFSKKEWKIIKRM
ncbi:MAG: glycosyltransferase [Elusimicrobiota bacterium]|jgi:glycosyltransferase involved in cell wall biosynthesis|nr:glycosyltransferase [Elusimicrobiota bacterium]